MKTQQTVSRSRRLSSIVLGLLGCVGVTSTASASIVGSDIRATVSSIVGSDAGILASPFVVAGPVEAIDQKSLAVIVLGQKYYVSDKTLLSANGRSLGFQALRVLKALQVGQYVVVAGDMAGANLVAQQINRLNAVYVTGATSVYVKGRVSQVDASRGQVRIGELWVDYTAVLSSNPLEALAVGAVVELAGIQPSAHGIALASQGRIVAPSSIVGSDTNSIVGSDTNSIVGSDTNSIVGSDTRSIVGSDTRSIVGSDTRSIVGSDTRSIVGSDTNSIVGSDTRSIVGSDTRSIVGSDTNSIVGSDTRSIVGSDTRSIVGSDTRSIVGSDTR